MAAPGLAFLARMAEHSSAMLARIVSVLSLSLVLACGGDDSGGTAGTDSVSTTASTTDTATASDTTPTASAGSSGTTSTSAGTTSAGSASAGTTGDGPPCSSPGDCADTEYCEFPDDSCGVSGLPGTCQARPTGCSADPRPVCGCDGVNYDGLCHAAAAGMDVEFLAECDVPNGAFACGYSYCIGGEEYCLQTGGAMPTFECIELAPVCSPGNCFCMSDCCGCDNTDCCAGHCDNSTGQTVITCPG